jgi:NADH-quinone oxidoreductase subunit M
MPSYLVTSPDGVPWLTLLVLSPLVGMALVGLAALMRVDDRTVKIGVIGWMFVPIVLAAVVWAGFDPWATSEGQGTVQFVEKVPWVRAIRVDYFLGVDGISLPMVLLTVIMSPIAALSSFKLNHLPKVHFALLLLLEMAMLGFFVALDFFFFFIFWEFSLVPAYFLIRSWGRSHEHRNYAAFKFFIYTMAGSAAMLLLFEFFYLSTRAAGFPTFNLIALGRLGQGLGLSQGSLGLGLPAQPVQMTLQEIMFQFAEQLGLTVFLSPNPLLYTAIAFWAIFMAFAVKLAVWPFHTWLPDAYGEAPIAGSILLSAVMSKMGAYGMLRIMLPLVPGAAQQFAPVVGTLALIGIIAGAFGALAYNRGDIKRLIGYTSINHMGYVMLAIAAAAAMTPQLSPETDELSPMLMASILDSRASAVNGALMQMVAHGLSTGGLFFLAGFLYDRTGSYKLDDFGGLRLIMPGFAGVMGIIMFGNLGLPGLAGFVGEFFIFRGAWTMLPFPTFFATIGLIVTALALLIMFQRIFLGPVNERWRHLAQQDLHPRTLEFWSLMPLAVLLLVFGIYPAPVMNLTNAAATQMVSVFMNLLS